MIDDSDLYELTDNEGRQNALGVVNVLAYVLLAVFVIITGAHAVMLVLSQTSTYTLAGGDNMISAIFTAIRVAFPLLVEGAAVVAGLGFIQSRWRGSQATIGLLIEVVWLLFAAANMITFFAVERGQELQNWQTLWVQYGLPVSALIAGSLTYMLLRSDPAHKRDKERAATVEYVAAKRFKFYQQARLSPEALAIEEQRAYMSAIQELRKQGFTAAQIDYMTNHLPELADGNQNSRSNAVRHELPTAADAQGRVGATANGVGPGGNSTPDFH